MVYLLAFLLVCGAAGIAAYCFLPASSTPRYTVVAIPRNAGALQIGVRLRRHGIIRSARAFSLMARLLGESRNLKAGDYRLSPHMSLAQIVSIIARGESVSIWVTIPEGYTINQVAERLEELGLVSKRRFILLAQTGGKSFHIPGLKLPSNLEGYLFPDTYKFSRRANERQIIETMLANFAWKVAKPLKREFAESTLPMPQVITLASLVEREAKKPEERPLIAGVLLNRLRLGMPLQCDASVQYALGTHKARLSIEDTKVDSPYNTYQHKGLPPGPICNPGLACIKAVLNPAPTRYLYYVAKPDGSHVFSTTFEEHVRAKKRIAASSSQS